jgi:hypothetical protein
MNARFCTRGTSNDFRNAPEADIRERVLSLQLKATSGHSGRPDQITRGNLA